VPLNAAAFRPAGMSGYRTNDRFQRRSGSLADRMILPIFRSFSEAALLIVHSSQS